MESNLTDAQKAAKEAEKSKVIVKPEEDNIAIVPLIKKGFSE